MNTSPPVVVSAGACWLPAPAVVNRALRTVLIGSLARHGSAIVEMNLRRDSGWWTWRRTLRRALHRWKRHGCVGSILWRRLLELLLVLLLEVAILLVVILLLLIMVGLVPIVALVPLAFFKFPEPP